MLDASIENLLICLDIRKCISIRCKYVTGLVVESNLDLAGQFDEVQVDLFIQIDVFLVRP